jgi:chemotaxis protein CheC
MGALTATQIDALQELINIGIGQAANLLNEMVESRIMLEVPTIQILNPVSLQQLLLQRFDGERLAAVRQAFKGSFNGTAELMFPRQSASTLVAVLTGEALDSPDLDVVKIGTLSEIGNIVINGVLGTISNLLASHLEFSLPIYVEDSVTNIVQSYNFRDSTVILAQARFKVEQLEIIGDIVLIFEVTSFDALIEAIDKAIKVSL